MRLRTVCVYGGTGISEQIAELKRGAEVSFQIDAALWLAYPMVGFSRAPRNFFLNFVIFKIL